MKTFFFFLEIIDLTLKQQKNEIKFYFEVEDMSVQFCNFNNSEKDKDSELELTLFCNVSTKRLNSTKKLADYKDDNIVFVYSIQRDKQTTKCKNIYKIHEKAE